MIKYRTKRNYRKLSCGVYGKSEDQKIGKYVMFHADFLKLQIKIKEIEFNCTVFIAYLSEWKLVIV